MDKSRTEVEPVNGNDGQKRSVPLSYLIRCVILPVIIGVAAIAFGSLKEPETVRTWSRLWNLVNAKPEYAAMFGVFLIVLAVRAYFRGGK